LRFEDNAALERYYEAKYREGGYDGSGCCIHGLDVSSRYHRARHVSALRLLAPQPADTVLDAGCGNGDLSADLVQLCHRVLAVDIAGNAMSDGVRALANVRFEKMNLESLTFPNGHVDGIVCVEALEHVLHPDVVLSEFHRVLKPNGRLVLTYPTINRTVVQRWQSRVGLGTRLDISEHLTEWSYDELVDRAEHAGFRVVSSEGIAFDFGLIGRLKYLSRTLAEGFTSAALGIRRFPRNSSFVSVALHKGRR
jgi:ubiquinone/menaquinone biosynthesis C-methylase UbiE